MHEAFCGNITKYFAHAQTVCIRPLLRWGWGGGGGGGGGGGTGDEASMDTDFLNLLKCLLLTSFDVTYGCVFVTLLQSLGPGPVVWNG